MKYSKIETWLPIFSGFYETIWETDNDEEMEIEHLNELRKEKGLPAIEWDDVEWDYKTYTKAVVEGFTSEVETELKKLGMVSKIKFQKVSSPREYNFANDAGYIEVSLTKENRENITEYLDNHKLEFSKYLQDHYTSYDGFMSSYSNDLGEWLDNLEDVLNHQHKLGAVLDFILRNEDQLREMDIYETLHGNGCFLQASNYSKLVPTGGI